MIACGMVELDELTADQRKRLQNAARVEAHSFGYWVSGCRSAQCCIPSSATTWATSYGRTPATTPHPHKLTRWNKKMFRDNPRRPGINDRNRPLAEGTFEGCCEALVRLITPSNPTE